jgi:hypothetical protein
MNRGLGVERTYQVANFEPIKFSDYINELPDELAFNNELVNRIRYLQFLNIEMSYRNYLLLAKSANQMPIADAMAFLEEEKATTLDEIKSIIFKKEEDK